MPPYKRHVTGSHQLPLAPGQTLCRLRPSFWLGLGLWLGLCLGLFVLVAVVSQSQARAVEPTTASDTFGPSSPRQPGTGQPGTGQPGTGQSGTGQSGTGQSGTGASSSTGPRILQMERGETGQPVLAGPRQPDRYAEDARRTQQVGRDSGNAIRDDAQQDSGGGDRAAAASRPRGKGTRIGPVERSTAAAAKPAKAAKGTFGSPLANMLGSLAIVLALFFLLIWFVKRTQGGRDRWLPGEVVQSLGRAPMMGRQQLQLLRFGNKLVLLSVTPTSSQLLTEITDPQEVDRLAAVCQQGQSASSSQSFRSILNQFASEPASGFLEQQPVTARNRRRAAATAES